MRNRKIFLAATLAMLILVAGSASAADFTVGFNATNPNVTVTAYRGPYGVYQWEGTAQFTLTGTGSAAGSIYSGTTGVFECYTDYTGQPSVVGGYTASGGDFQSQFNANSYMLDGPSYFGHGCWSTHGIAATGVTAGGMTVNGDATAAYGCSGGFVEGGQIFSGVAESVKVYGSKMDSTKQGIDPTTWDPKKFTGAEFKATALGDSTVSFGGSTDAGTYPVGGETSSCRVLSKQGLGFLINAPGASSLVGSLITTYSYTNTQVEPYLIVGDTSTSLTGAPGWNYNQWSGVPGYLTNP